MEGEGWVRRRRGGSSEGVVVVMGVGEACAGGVGLDWEKGHWGGGASVEVLARGGDMMMLLKSQEKMEVE